MKVLELYGIYKYSIITTGLDIIVQYVGTHNGQPCFRLLSAPWEINAPDTNGDRYYNLVLNRITNVELNDLPKRTKELLFYNIKQFDRCTLVAENFIISSIK